MPVATETHLDDNSTEERWDTEHHTWESRVPQVQSPHDVIEELSLPEESGVIELRADGSVTVAGHRVRLKTVFDFIVTTNDRQKNLSALSARFPTIERPLLFKVCKYIAMHFDAVQQHAKREDELFSQLIRTAVTITTDDLKRRVGR